MKAVICTKYGAPEVLEIQDIVKPVAKNDEILGKIISTAVNSGDTRVRSLDVDGIMKIIMKLVLGFSKPRKPILGTVYAGIVENVGQKVSRFKNGDKVFGMTGFKFGTYAEYIAVKEKSLVSLMPSNANFDEAASLIFGGQTAIYFLDKSKIERFAKPNILIIGATGSVGVSVLQIALHQGANITAVCSSAGQNLVKELGVSKIILYDKEDFTKIDEKFDFIFDAVGKTSKKQCQVLLKKEGVYKTVGGTDFASESLQQLERLKYLFETGSLKAVIDKTFPLNKIVESHKYVDTGRKKGNVVLKISE